MASERNSEKEFDNSLSPNSSSSVPDKEDQVSRAEMEESEEQEAHFEPIRAGDEAHLRRIASTISERQKSFHGRHHENTSLEKTNTLAGLSPDSPELNPDSPEFDVYKWARMMMHLLDEKGVKQRRAGVVWRDLRVSGTGSALQLQATVGSMLMAPFRIGEVFGSQPEKIILNDFEGCLKSGEMLVVLGRPGSGCSTFLKTITGELQSLKMGKDSVIHYNGIPQETMLKQFKGEVVYNQEVDKHFPHLTVGQTLEFAAKTRTPQQRALDIDRKTYAQQITQIVMAVFGLTHTYNTKVGNDFVRGVSGGERKRVSLAEMALAGSPIAAWDNSTRGLDAATALEFTKSLRMSSNLAGTVQAVAIYQASESIYQEFDKATVLYEGRQIYFGPAKKAKQYFIDMGWECPKRQTTGDFLTSITNPQERKPRDGFDGKVPRTPQDFEQYWKQSEARKQLMQEMDEHEEKFPVGGDTIKEMAEGRKAMQAKYVRPESPYTVSIPMQIKYLTQRSYQRVWNDKTAIVTTSVGQIVMALIIGSIFYDTPNNTASFFQKGGVLFFAVLLNALISVNEINSLYDQRPIVEKQASYAFYHPFAEAFAGILADIPVKFIIAVGFNIILYFLSGLRREPSQFFIYFLFSFVITITMSQVFRGVAATTKTVSQALAIAGILILVLVIYTGYVIPRKDMHPWFKWLTWINPVFYAFEALMVNELHGRRFACSALVPSYGTVGDTFICNSQGAVIGQMTVSGDDFVETAYGYTYAHIWRNLGILFAFMLFFMFIYLVATEFNSATSSTAEVLVFRRGHVPKYLEKAEKAAKNDEEAVAAAPAGGNEDEELDREQDDKIGVLAKQTDVFTWRNVCYDIPVKEGQRRLLDNVSGWVKPGTLTALMGVSGAGKTTLLDVLAQRVSMGVVTGDMFVSGKPLDESFQRKTGYVQQQDLHLETTTVREALRFSALLRQPKSVSKQEKFEFVEDVIKMLNMSDFAEAVVGVPGEGLNVEQRKLLTIGVELAAKPALLLFLDEPTSGLDSQSSWAIVAFLRKLADNGQAVLATIHQPSAILFQEFDRLLFLAKGGKTVYFGDIGKDSHTLLDYFSRNGAKDCAPDENPAEYMLTMVGAGATGKSDKDWHQVWKDSSEAKEVQEEINKIHEKMASEKSSDDSAESHSEFAMPFTYQLQQTTIRVFQQYWRTPEYIYAKLFLGIASALFIGFSFFQAPNTQQGLQDVVFSIFMVTTIFTTLVQQIMPRFVTQRDLYEVRERPSKAYSWAAFLIANLVVELPYQILLGIVVYASYYYPIFGIPSSARQGLTLLFITQFFVFASTFAHMLISFLPDAETAGNIATLLFALCLTFNGVFQPPQALPGFWIFMYRVSPLTYLVGGIVGTGLHARPVVCARSELAIMNPPSGQTCSQWLSTYANASGGSIYNPSATSNCEFCSYTIADQFLEGVGISYSDRWRNYGLGFVYIVFNICAAVAFYYLVRVRPKQKRSEKGGKGKGGKDGKQAEGERKAKKGVLGMFRRDPKEEPKGEEKKRMANSAAMT